jgi:SEC-C motif-containing protein
MRSRFSAYATNNGQYIYNTYANTTRSCQSLNDIQQWANECIWLALEVHESSRDTVVFSAYYIVDNTLCCLTERSNFIIEKGLWRYLDGDISSNKELCQVKRNELCPCNHYPSAFAAKKGKKFKHCCGR